MNKKGFISVIRAALIILFIMSLALIQEGFNFEDKETLKKGLNWTVLGANITKSFENVNTNNNEFSTAIMSIAGKVIDFFGFTITTLGVMVVDFAFNNPNIINYKVLFTLFILSLLAPLIYPIFIVIISIILIIKEYFLTKKEKKEMENKNIQNMKGGK